MFKMGLGLWIRVSECDGEGEGWILDLVLGFGLRIALDLG